MIGQQCIVASWLFILICSPKTSLTGSTADAPISNCQPNIDIRFGDEHEQDTRNRQSGPYKKPHAAILSYDDVAYSFLTTANTALKLTANECRQDVCTWAKNYMDVGDISGSGLEIAYVALKHMPYGLRLLLCSDVVIRSIKLQEILFADNNYNNSVQTARILAVEGEALWRFVLVDNTEKRMQFRIRNVKTNEYLVAERKFSLVSDQLRRVVLTDPVKSDIWEVKMLSDWNGNFNRFRIMNVNLGEYLYASRGFCYDNSTTLNLCSARPSFTWEYKTLIEAEEDDYNQFIIDDYAFN